ncbi:acetyl-CoA carboxylase biotin carboxyl carrier protein [Variovorax saccharolyticus]|uniref:acetyl-CoA carboxylase biotin carboxyl carrier protein n=1 Tax=Variovorax saccharolyticus TaxID=3053516 RepID=UPI002574CCDE|nr:acetyl-CoA carboxylase biotin carboxyl carrier protein subunit [Variovorax sp. J31P216]MDM0026104.1 acetyl-CoA carboxylase biotin carboxyl carrier protein subunit [Variovorax sp. J31P216]
MKKAPHELREIAGWMAATDIGFLELRMPGVTVRLERRGEEVVTLDHGQRADAQAEGRANPAGLRPDTVTAGSVGVFLHAHPGATAPFVRTGIEVLAGQTLGLLRIGVLLLPVLASRAGTVAALRAGDGATVGYGAPLVDLHPF